MQDSPRRLKCDSAWLISMRRLQSVDMWKLLLNCKVYFMHVSKIIRPIRYICDFCYNEFCTFYRCGWHTIGCDTIAEIKLHVCMSFTCKLYQLVIHSVIHLFSQSVTFLVNHSLSLFNIVSNFLNLAAYKTNEVRTRCEAIDK